MAKANVVRLAGFSPLSEDLEAAIDGFLSYCKSKNLSGNTLIYYQYRLQAFDSFVGSNYPGTSPNQVTPQLVREFLTAQAKDHSPSTAKHGFIALNAFFNFLVNDGFLSVNPMEKVDKPRCRQTVINTFSLEQLQGVLATCKKDFTGVRDRAMIILTLDYGLRVSELCGLTPDG